MNPRGRYAGLLVLGLVLLYFEVILLVKKQLTLSSRIFTPEVSSRAYNEYLQVYLTESSF